MAEARAQGRILVLVVAWLLGLTASALGQPPVVVEQRPIPPSPLGELGQSDVMRAVAMIRDLGATFHVMAGRGGADQARWAIYQRTYFGAANRLDAMLADGQISVRDLPSGQPAATTDGGMVLDPALGGVWQPDVVRTRRRLGAGDWTDISRLVGVLVERLALENAAGAWDAWITAHDQDANFRELAGGPPDDPLRPLLVRFWHLQDKYLANTLADAGGDIAVATRALRAAALGNEMLAVLKQAESTGGWQSRKTLETAWRESDRQVRAMAGMVPAPEPAPPVEVVTTADSVAEPDVAPPRSTDFDELFTGKEPAPLTTAAGPEDEPARGADIDALTRENTDRAEETRDLAVRLTDLSGQVKGLAASVAEQGRQLQALTDGVAVTRTIPEALAALTASQTALERRLADLGREVGPDGLAGQLVAIEAAMESERSRSRDTEQGLEARVEERLRAVSRDVAAARRQVADLDSRLSAFRPSATAVEVPLQDAVARRTAFRQAVVAGVALLVLLLAAIGFWVRGVRERGVRQRSVDSDWADAETTDQDAAGPEAPTPAQGEGFSALMAGLHLADQNALRDELTQLRDDIESERSRAGDLEERLTRVTTQLGESQARGKRLAADLAAVRADTQTVGRGLIDGAARDQAMGNELTGLRQAIEAERSRAEGLQRLVDELKSSVAAAAAPDDDREAAPEPGVPPPAPSATADHAVRQRAIEALHRSDLPGFEQAFAKLTALPLPAVERLVRHNGVLDLALACRAVDIAKPHLAAILILSRRARPGDQPLAPRDLAEAMTAFDEFSAEAAEQTLRGWRARAYEADRLSATELSR